MKLITTIFIIAVLGISHQGIAQVQLGQDLTAVGMPNNFGRAVALDSIGHRVAVGSPLNSDSAEYSGQVKVFDLLDTNWVQVGQTLNGVGWHDYFGRNVGLNANGTILIVNISQEGISGGGGYIQVFQLNDSLWQQMGSNIYSSMAPYGQPIDINSNGSRIIVGSNSNYATVYEWNDQLFEWVQLGSTLIGSNACSPYEYFGRHVAMDGSGNRIVVAADNYDIGCSNSSDAGKVTVFEWNGNDWSQVGQSITGENSYNLGVSIDISGNGTRIACGAPSPSLPGRVFTYELNQGDNTWDLYGDTISGAIGDQLGRDVNLNYNGCIIACGAMEPNGPGRVERYKLESDNWLLEGQNLSGAASFSSGAGLNGTVAINSSGYIVSFGSSNFNGGICRVYEYQSEPDTSVVITTCSGLLEYNGITYDSSGTFTQSISSVNSCDSIVQLALTIVNLDTTLVETNGELTANQEDASYQWYNCDTGNEIIGANEQTFIPSENGNYAVMLSNGVCEVSSECINVQTVSISEFKSQYIKVYPNPVQDKIYFGNEISGELSVLTSDGRILIVETINQKSSVQIGSMARGIYFLNILTKEGLFTGKFLVE